MCENGGKPRLTAMSLCMTLLLSVVLFFMAACKRASFMTSSSYFDLPEDSIRKLLHEASDAGRLSDEEQAAYALLALKVEKDTVRMDSLQRIAYLYYSGRNDSASLALCYYYGGLLAEFNDKEMLAAACYLRCAEIYPRQDGFLAHVNLFLGFLYNDLGDNKEAIRRFRQCALYREQQKAWEGAGFALMWMTPLYLEPDVNEPDSAIHYGLITLDYMKRSNSVFLDTPYLTISQAYSMKGDFEKAREYNELSKKAQGNSSTLRQTANQVSILYHLGKYDDALECAFQIPDDYYNVHENDLWIARIYEKMGRYKDALAYEKKYCEEELDKRNAWMRKNLSHLRHLIEHNETTEQNSLMKAEAKKHFYKLLVATITFLLFGVGIFSLYRFRMQRIRNRLKEKELEQQILEHKLEKQKRKEAELRESFFRQLNRLSLQAGGTKRRTFTDEEWQLLLDNANAAFGQFTDKLKQRYPNLNEEDIRYCCLTKMGLSQAEISEIVCREKVSVKKRIRRIAIDKMGAKEGQLLRELIDKI